MKKNKSLALIATTTDPVGAVCKSLTPPPSKQDVLRAAAKAISQQRMAEYEAKQKEWMAKDEVFNAKIHQLVTVHKGLSHRHELTRSYQDGNDWVMKVIVVLDQKTRDQVQERFSSRPLCEPCNPDSIYKELLAKSKDNSAVVHSLLSDPEMKERLIKVGKALLSRGEKASAITVS